MTYGKTSSQETENLRRIRIMRLTLLILVFFLPLTITARDPPNIVFILADDLGSTQVGCYGSSYYLTPNLDRLSAEGIRFTNAYAAAAVCSPTRASIMTGKYPARLHLTDFIAGNDRDDYPLVQPDWQKFLPAADGSRLSSLDLQVCDDE